jgi:hypothetical protein
MSRLTEGVQWTALAIDTDRPLFWFLGGRKVKSMGARGGAGGRRPFRRGVRARARAYGRLYAWRSGADGAYIAARYHVV